MSPMRKKLAIRLKKFISTIKSAFRRKSHSRKQQWPMATSEPLVYQAEEYLPGHIWDALDPGERYASVGDLCAHVGDQLPVQVVKLIARDLLRGLENLHETRGIAHSDIKPDTVLLSPSDMKALISQLSADNQTQISLLPSGSSSKTVYLDVHTLLASPDPLSVVFRLSNVEAGTISSVMAVISEINPLQPSTTIDQPRRERFIDRVQSYALRAPEVILGAPCDTSVDLWSLGCLLYELLTGESLIDPFFQTVELGLTPEESHLIQIIELFGEFPEDLLQAGEHSNRWFNEAGAMRLETTYYPVTLESILGSHLEETDIATTADFLRTMLQLRPQERSKARDIVDHPWFSS